MRLFWTPKVVDLTPDDLKPSTLLDDIHDAFSRALDELRGLVADLDEEIADRTERRRQAKVAIASFEAAQKAARNGGEVDKPVLADTGEADRLVPRTVKGGRP